MSLSRKGIAIEPSITLDIAAKANIMKEKGIDIINFSIGEPDFNTPENIQEEGINAIRNGKTKYTASSGINDLKLAFAKKLKEDNSLDYGPSNILISNGGKHSIYNALLALLNPGDEVIISTPCWVSYIEMIKLCDGVPIVVETEEKNDFKFCIEELDKVKTEKTKAIIINSPNNPTGYIFNRDELKKIAEWCVSNNIYVISDELYEKLIYDESKHISIASLNPEIKKLTITIMGMSKSYAMTGWRIGFAAAEQEIIKVMTSIQSHTTANASSISQYASVEGLLGDQSSIEKMRQEYDKRRKYIVEQVNNIQGLSCREPKGAFYIMVNISELFGKILMGIEIKNSLEVTEFLLEKANVAVVPGIAFGDDNFIRLSYATSMENIIKGIKRINKVLK